MSGCGVLVEACRRGQLELTPPQLTRLLAALAMLAISAFEEVRQLASTAIAKLIATADHAPALFRLCPARRPPRRRARRRRQPDTGVALAVRAGAALRVVAPAPPPECERPAAAVPERRRGTQKPTVSGSVGVVVGAATVAPRSSRARDGASALSRGQEWRSFAAEDAVAAAAATDEASAAPPTGGKAASSAHSFSAAGRRSAFFRRRSARRPWRVTHSGRSRSHHRRRLAGGERQWLRSIRFRQ